MQQIAPDARDHEWVAYYKQFPYFSSKDIRDGCHPRIMEHEEPTEKAIVLVHGLSDSPYYMTAIGEYFFNELRYNVYLPLLQCHGLKDPKGMEVVNLDEWKANVNFAIETAKAANSKPKKIAIGGLSTGGALSFYTAVKNPDITGTLFLFSAALDLAGGIWGEIKERLLRFPGVPNGIEGVKPEKNLIGTNPYRYAYIDLDGAGELGKLIKETDDLFRQFNKKKLFSKRVFAAHSESDTTASISGIEDLKEISVPDRFTFFRIPAGKKVSHASVVLKDPIYATDASEGDEPLEKANPQFKDMMEAIATIE